MMLHQVVAARKNCHCLDLVSHNQSSQASSRASVYVVRSRNVLCGKRVTKSWKNDGICVCDTAPSFLGLGKGTQVLCSTSNKRNTLGDQDNTFHTKAFSGRFSFLKQHTRRPKEHTTFHSRTLAFARSPIHLLPNASKNGLDEFLCDVLKVTVPLRCTLCTTLPSHGHAVLQLRPQLRHCTEPDQDFHKLTCLTVSFPAATATEKILEIDANHFDPLCIHMDKDFLNCDTVKSSSSHTHCSLFDGGKGFPKHSCFPRRVPKINVKTDTLGSKTTSKPLISNTSFWIGSGNVWLVFLLDIQVFYHCETVLSTLISPATLTNQCSLVEPHICSQNRLAPVFQHPQ